MEIKIELDIEKVEPNIITISDKGFDSAENWINIKLKDHLGKETNLGDVRLNDLMPALIAFDAKYSRQTPIRE